MYINKNNRGSGFVNFMNADGDPADTFFPSLPVTNLPAITLNSPTPAPTSAPKSTSTPSAPKTNSLSTFFTNLGEQITTGLVTKLTTPKTGVAADVKAVCGTRPLFNFGGRKDAYDTCAQNYVNSQSAAAQAQAAAAIAANQKKPISVGTVLGITAGALAITGVVVAVIMHRSKKGK